MREVSLEEAKDARRLFGLVNPKLVRPSNQCKGCLSYAELPFGFCTFNGVFVSPNEVCNDFEREEDN